MRRALLAIGLCAACGSGPNAQPPMPDGAIDASGGSATWTPLTAAYGNNFVAVTGAGSAAFFAADDGAIATWDGAALTTLAPAMTASGFAAAYAIAPDDVWFVGYPAYVAHWDGTALSARSPGSSANFVSVWGGASGDVWIADATATAQHWTGAGFTPVTPTGMAVYGFSGTSTTDVWAVGAGGTISHYDGATWTAVTSPVSSVYTVGAVYAITPTLAIATATSGQALRWDGTSWTIDATLIGSRFGGTGVDDLWGLTTYQQFHFDGTTWTTYSNEYANALWVSSDGTAWIAGGSGLIGRHTACGWQFLSGLIDAANAFTAMWGDGTTTWLGTSYGPLASVGSCGLVFTTSADDAVALGGTGASDLWEASYAGYIGHWDGAAYTAIALPDPNARASALWAIAPDDVWAVGPGGLILHDDGTWTAVTSPTTLWLTAVWAASSTDVWAAGEQGTLLHYDGGAWTAAQSGAVQHLYAVWGASSADVWAVGELGTILHWDGAAWARYASGTTATLRAIHGANANDVWATGDGGTVVQWAGHGWRAVATPTTEALAAIHVDANVTIGGAGATLLQLAR